MHTYIAAHSGGIVVVACGVGAGVRVRVLARRLVHYTAHGFTGHRLQRMFLTRRHATPVRLSPVIVARRARRPKEPRIVAPDPDIRPESERGWALASLALMVLVVVLACCAAGIRLH